LVSRFTSATNQLNASDVQLEGVILMIKKLAIASTMLAAVFTTFAGIATAEATKVGFVYLTTAGDHGWTYAHELGRQMVEEKFGDDVVTTYVENVTEGPDATRIIRELAQQGNEIIFTTSFGYMEPTLKVSKEFPNVKFEHMTGYKRTPNMATSNIRFYEGRYVQGVVAGLMTTSNKIGYIGAYPISEVIMGINAFAQGMRSVNPDASISVIWANAWYDPVKEAAATKVHIAEGADILAQHTDSPVMLQIAEQHGVRGFGQSTDNYAFAPKAQLFANINNWGPYYVSRIEALRNGTWTTGEDPNYWAGNTWGGLSTGMLLLSEFRNMPPDVKAEATKAMEGIRSGAIKIFAGPLIDNTGKQIIAAGEELDDAALWGMNYYLDGVNGRIPG
jgi:simple sugar transport system substrate-binding protein